VNEPTWLHGTVRGGLHFGLEAWVRGAPGRGAVNDPIDVLVDDRNVFGPDVVWYRDGRVPGLHDPRPYAMPDLVAEVRSPSTWRFDIGTKPRRPPMSATGWVSCGSRTRPLPCCSASAVRRPSFDEALELTRGDLLSSPRLRGFELPLDELFGGG